MSTDHLTEKHDYEVVRIKRETLHINEREAARLRLQQSVDQLGREASLHANMQKEPLKMLGVATGVGAAMGMLMGRSVSRTKKIYVHPELNKKDQKAFEKAQKLQQRGNTDVGGALVATLGTLAFKVLQDRVLAPKLEEIAHGLTEKATTRERSSQVKPATVLETQPAHVRVNPSTLANGLLHPENPGEVEGVIVRDFRPEAQRARLDQYGNEIYGSKLHKPVAPLAVGASKELSASTPSVVVEDKTTDTVDLDKPSLGRP